MTIYTPQPHQQQAYDIAIANCKANTNTLLNIGTGGGKAYIVAMLSNVLPTRTLVLVHTQELVSQNREEYEQQFNKNNSTIVCAGLKQDNITGHVIFATPQTFIKYCRDDKFILFLKTIKNVIVDECHRIQSKDKKDAVYHRILDKIPQANIIGLTATDYEANGSPKFGQNYLFKKRDFLFSIADTEQAGATLPLKFDTCSVGYTLKDIRVRGDYVEAELSKALMEQEQITRQMIAEFLAKWDGKKCLMFSVSIEHAKLCNDILAEHGINFAMITGDKKITPDKQRKQILKDFADGKIDILNNVSVLTTGFNVKDLANLLILRPTQSVPLIQQIWGRGVRVAPDKKHCTVYDYARNYEQHGDYRHLHNIVNKNQEQIKAEGQKAYTCPCGGIAMKKKNTFFCNDCKTRYIKCECTKFNVVNKDTKKCIVCKSDIYKQCEKCNGYNFQSVQKCKQKDCDFVFGDPKVGKGVTKISKPIIVNSFSVKTKNKYVVVTLNNAEQQGNNAEQQVKLMFTTNGQAGWVKLQAKKFNSLLTLAGIERWKHQPINLEMYQEEQFYNLVNPYKLYIIKGKEEYYNLAD